MSATPLTADLLERGDNLSRVTATFTEVRQSLESWSQEYLQRWGTITGQPVTWTTSELSCALLVMLRNVEQGRDWKEALRRIIEPFRAFWTAERCQFAEDLWFEVLSDVPEIRHWDGETWLAWDALLNDIRAVVVTMDASSAAPSLLQRIEIPMEPSRTQQIPVDDLIDHMQSALQSSTAREIPSDISSFDAILPASGMRRPISSESNPMPLDLQAPPVNTAAGQQQSSHFYGIVEHLPLPALFVDASGILSFLNHRGHELLRTFEEETGVGPEQLVGQGIARLVDALPGLQGLGGAKLQATGIRFALGDETYVIEWSTVTSEQRRVGTVYVIRTITAQVQEATRRLEAEADQMAMTSLLTALQSAGSTTDAAMTALNLVRDGFGWAYGSYWTLDTEAKTLKFAAESGEVTSEFRRITESASFAQGVGLSGRTWKQRELVFVEDLSKVTDCVRAPAAQRAGVKSGVCFPIEVGGQVVATMDFFSLTTLTLSDSRRETLRSVGRLVSQTIDRLQETERQDRLMREMSRVQNMMDNLPINVIMAGRDTKIAYMNPATIRTLKTIEHLLPVTVEQLKGQSFDILHKAPEMQRRIVSDPKNLPHRARIKLGPETLDLLVTAISDNRGEYLGPMVTWSVITNQVKMADDFERDVKGVVEIVTSSATELQASSRNLAAASDETARQSQVVAAASEEATRNVETVSSAAEELSKSIAEIARHVQDASKMTSSAVTEADRTNITIKQLGDSSNEIGQVVKVITSIAQQTNLLALNATIEAARAGEAGKGFAVVANEVKELARQTAKATEEISQKILAIQSATGIAVTAIGSISDSIRKINEISTTIASAVEEQTAATNEISRNVSEAARGTAEVSSNITGVSQASDEGGRGASDILVAAEGLARESVRLDNVASSFLERMRKL